MLKSKVMCGASVIKVKYACSNFIEVKYMWC